MNLRISSTLFIIALFLFNPSASVLGQDEFQSDISLSDTRSTLENYIIGVLQDEKLDSQERLDKIGEELSKLHENIKKEYEKTENAYDIAFDIATTLNGDLAVTMLKVSNKESISATRLFKKKTGKELVTVLKVLYTGLPNIPREKRASYIKSKKAEEERRKHSQELMQTVTEPLREELLNMLSNGHPKEDIIKLFEKYGKELKSEEDLNEVVRDIFGGVMLVPQTQGQLSAKFGGWFGPGDYKTPLEDALKHGYAQREKVAPGDLSSPDLKGSEERKDVIPTSIGEEPSKKETGTPTETAEPTKTPAGQPEEKPKEEPTSVEEGSNVENIEPSTPVTPIVEKPAAQPASKKSWWESLLGVSQKSKEEVKEPNAIRTILNNDDLLRGGKQDKILEEFYRAGKESSTGIYSFMKVIGDDITLSDRLKELFGDPTLHSLERAFEAGYMVQQVKKTEGASPQYQENKIREAFHAAGSDKDLQKLLEEAAKYEQATEKSRDQFIIKTKIGANRTNRLAMEAFQAPKEREEFHNSIEGKLQLGLEPILDGSFKGDKLEEVRKLFVKIGSELQTELEKEKLNNLISQVIFKVGGVESGAIVSAEKIYRNEKPWWPWFNTEIESLSKDLLLIQGPEASKEAPAQVVHFIQKAIDDGYKQGASKRQERAKAEERDRKNQEKALQETIENLKEDNKGLKDEVERLKNSVSQGLAEKAKEPTEKINALLDKEKQLLTEIESLKGNLTESEANKITLEKKLQQLESNREALKAALQEVLDKVEPKNQGVLEKAWNWLWQSKEEASNKNGLEGLINTISTKLDADKESIKSLEGLLGLKESENKNLAEFLRSIKAAVEGKEVSEIPPLNADDITGLILYMSNLRLEVRDKDAAIEQLKLTSGKSLDEQARIAIAREQEIKGALQEIQKLKGAIPGATPEQASKLQEGIRQLETSFQNYHTKLLADLEKVKDDLKKEKEAREKFEGNVGAFTAIVTEQEGPFTDDEIRQAKDKLKEIIKEFNEQKESLKNKPNITQEKEQLVVDKVKLNTALDTIYKRFDDRKLSKGEQELGESVGRVITSVDDYEKEIKKRDAQIKMLEQTVNANNSELRFLDLVRRNAEEDIETLKTEGQLSNEKIQQLEKQIEDLQEQSKNNLTTVTNAAVSDFDTVKFLKEFNETNIEHREKMVQAISNLAKDLSQKDKEKINELLAGLKSTDAKYEAALKTKYDALEEQWKKALSEKETKIGELNQQIKDLQSKYDALISKGATDEIRKAFDKDLEKLQTQLREREQEIKNLKTTNETDARGKQTKTEELQNSQNLLNGALQHISGVLGQQLPTIATSADLEAFKKAVNNAQNQLKDDLAQTKKDLALVKQEYENYKKQSEEILKKEKEERTKVETELATTKGILENVKLEKAIKGVELDQITGLLEDVQKELAQARQEKGASAASVVLLENREKELENIITQIGEILTIEGLDVKSSNALKDLLPKVQTIRDAAKEIKERDAIFSQIETLLSGTDTSKAQLSKDERKGLVALAAQLIEKVNTLQEEVGKGKVDVQKSVEYYVAKMKELTDKIEAYEKRVNTKDQELDVVQKQLKDAQAAAEELKDLYGSALNRANYLQGGWEEIFKAANEAGIQGRHEEVIRQIKIALQRLKENQKELEQTKWENEDSRKFFAQYLDEQFKKIELLTQQVKSGDAQLNALSEDFAKLKEGYDKLVKKMQAEADKKRQTLLNQLEDLKENIPVYIDQAAQRIKVVERAGTEQAFNLMLKAGPRLPVLKEIVRGMKFAGYANQDGTLQSSRDLAIYRNGEEIPVTKRLSPGTILLPIKDKEGIGYIVKIDVELRATRSISIIHLTPEQRPKAYFVKIMSVDEAPWSKEARTRTNEDWAAKKAREAQAKLLEKEHPVYVNVSGFDKDGYTFKLKFSKAHAAKLNMLPDEVQGYKFMSYADEQGHLTGGEINLLIGDREVRKNIDMATGQVKLEGVEFEESAGHVKKFNVTLEMAGFPVPVLGGNEPVSGFMIRILKVEPVAVEKREEKGEKKREQDKRRSLREELRKAMQETG